MASTIIPFTPNSTSVFQTIITLDGVEYRLITSWNLWGRWYINIYDLSGNLIVTEPLIASPNALPLAPPQETETIQSMTWDDVNGGTVSVVMQAPSVFTLGDSINIQGATNDGTAGDAAVNGIFVITQWMDDQHFQFLLTAADGEIGTISGAPEIVFNTHALMWDNHTGNGIVTANTAAPHKLPLGVPVVLSITGASPDVYNGTYTCLPINSMQFTFPLDANPGMNTTPGNYCADINLVGAYFSSSRMIYREVSKQFEITP